MQRLLLFALLVANAGLAAEIDSDDWDTDWEEASSGALIWSGFIEGGLGTRLNGSDQPHDLTLADARLRAETQWSGETLSLGFKADLLYDGVLDKVEADLRELSLGFSLGNHTDVSIGRQVLTWGTGDLVFLNDLFPKDFQSFFSGRDDEYLKAPSTAIRLTHYNQFLNADLVWTPIFEPDEYLTGERFSFYLPAEGAIGVPDPPFEVDDPSRDLGNGELALRLFSRRGTVEFAFYGYYGFFKQPRGLKPDGALYHPELSVFGASLRRPIAGGVFSTEFAWHDSRENRDGENPFVPTSQGRLLLGYEWELVRNWQIGLQYYAEYNANHDTAAGVAPDPTILPDRWRSLFTTRVSARLRRDTVLLSAFAFFSPSDEDAHLRLQAGYRMSDTWKLTAGANLFTGSTAHTFFAQLDDNDNVFVRLTRYY